MPWILSLSYRSVDFIQSGRSVYAMQWPPTLVYSYSFCCEYFGVKLHPIINKSFFKDQGWCDWNSIKNICSFVFADLVRVVLVLWKISDKLSLIWQENKREYWQPKPWFTLTSFHHPKVSTILNINVGINVLRVLCNVLYEQFITRFRQHIEHN